MIRNMIFLSININMLKNKKKKGILHALIISLNSQYKLHDQVILFSLIQVIT